MHTRLGSFAMATEPRRPPHHVPSSITGDAAAISALDALASAALHGSRRAEEDVVVVGGRQARPHSGETAFPVRSPDSLVEHPHFAGIDPALLRTGPTGTLTSTGGFTGSDGIPVDSELPIAGPSQPKTKRPRSSEGHDDTASLALAQRREKTPKQEWQVGSGPARPQSVPSLMQIHVRRNGRIRTLTAPSIRRYADGGTAGVGGASSRRNCLPQGPASRGLAKVSRTPHNP